MPLADKIQEDFYILFCHISIQIWNGGKHPCNGNIWFQIENK